MSESKRSLYERMVLDANGRDASSHEARIERELWYRNARFRAWSNFLPLEARWEPGGKGYKFFLSCTACESTRREERTPLDFARRSFAKDLDLIERVTIGRFLRAGCSHLGPLLAPDTEEVQAILELELLGGF